MNPMMRVSAAVAFHVLFAVFCMPAGTTALQQLTFLPQQEPQQIQQYVPQRAPIAADLQNQVHALSAQLAAANRQLQYAQQQLSQLANIQPQLQAQPQHQQVAPVQSTQPIGAQQFFAPQPVHQHQLQQQQQQQQQQAPLVSTLVDGADLSRDARYLSAPTDFNYRQPQPSQVQPAANFANQASVEQQQQQFQLQLQKQQQQQLQLQQQQANQFASQQQATSTTVGPPSIEPSFQVSQPDQAAPQQQQQAPPANQAPPHNPPRNDDKFSIGLGVLSPGYTQKFGNTALDFNQDKNGFSFTLSNNGHNNQPPKLASQQQTSSNQPPAQA